MRDRLSRSPLEIAHRGTPRRHLQDADRLSGCLLIPKGDPAIDARSERRRSQTMLFVPKLAGNLPFVPKRAAWLPPGIQPGSRPTSPASSPFAGRMRGGRRVRTKPQTNYDLGRR